MPSAPMILRIHFYHAAGQGKTALASAAHHVDYMLSPEKTELLVDARTSLESAAIHAKYADEREGSMGSFGTVSQAEARKQMLHAQGPVWRLIVSVAEADALAMGHGLTSKAGWERATRAAMADTLRAMRLDPANTEWIAAAHREQAGGEHNPHIHLLLWERGAPHRRTGRLTQDEIGSVRRALASSLYRPELDRIGAQKTAARDRSTAITRAIFSGPELAQGFVGALTDRLATLGDHLPAKGRLAYAYLPPAAKAEVLDLAHWLSDSQPDLKAAKAEFLEAAQAFVGVHWAPPGGSEWGGPEQAVKRHAALNAAIAKADQDFHQRMVGEILSAAAQTPNRTQAGRAADQIEAAVQGSAPEAPLSGVVTGGLRASIQAAANEAYRPLVPIVLTNEQVGAEWSSMDATIVAVQTTILADPGVRASIAQERQRIQAEFESLERGSKAAKRADARLKGLDARAAGQIQRQVQRAARRDTQAQVREWFRDEAIKNAWHSVAKPLRDHHDAKTRESIQTQAEQTLAPLAGQAKLTSEYAQQLIREGIQRRLEAHAEWWADHHRIEALIETQRRWKTQVRRNQVEPLAAVICEADPILRARWRAATLASDAEPKQTPYRIIIGDEAKTLEAQALSGPPRDAQSAVALLERDPVPESPDPTLQVGQYPPAPAPTQAPPAWAGLSPSSPMAHSLATVPWQAAPARFRPIRPGGASLTQPTTGTVLEPSNPTQYVIQPAIARQRQADVHQQIVQHVGMVGESLRWQQAHARARTIQGLLRSILMGLRGDDGRYQAYLAAKDRYAREKAEGELAMAQGIQIAR